jgi:DnaJ-domain-containing protein 1
MNIHEQVLKTILERPGASKKSLSRIFQLSDYRLNRVLRIIERDLRDRTIVHSHENGVWLVDVDPGRCSGMIWHGEDAGGYRQCGMPPRFRDGCCYEHSQCENLEIVAFRRKLEYLVGPVEPTAHYVSQLSMIVVEDLLKKLNLVTPLTRRDVLTKSRFLSIIRAAIAALKWKEEMRRRMEEDEIRPEFFARHWRSSVNPFEYGIKKCFVLLEVPADATKEEVLSAWRKLARQCHPDLQDGDEERMKAINLAKDKIFRIRRWD